MKKLIISILMTTLFLTFSGAAYAAGPGNIVEVPDVKIIMDGRMMKYSDVPICVGQNTLLPLRELMVNLGVPDENILYDDMHKSVTVTKNQIKLYMEVGSTIALVNDNPVKLNVAPVGYVKNQRIYIPFRFAAEALGKKVVWDGSANAIYVCDAQKYESMKKLLDKSESAMGQTSKCMVKMQVDGTIKSEQTSMELGVNAESQIDKANKAMSIKMSMDILGMEMTSDAYYRDNTFYALNPLDGKWEKKTYPQAEYDKLFAKQSNADMLKADEALCAGLIQTEGSGPDEILLSGDVYLGELLNKGMTEQQASKSIPTGDPAGFRTFHTVISLNSSTYLVNSIIMYVSSAKISNKATVDTDISVNVQYIDYNGGFQIFVPEDVIKNAVVKKP